MVAWNEDFEKIHLEKIGPIHQPLPYSHDPNLPHEEEPLPAPEILLQQQWEDKGKRVPLETMKWAENFQEAPTLPRIVVEEKVLSLPGAARASPIPRMKSLSEEMSTQFSYHEWQDRALPTNALPKQRPLWQRPSEPAGWLLQR